MSGIQVPAIFSPRAPSPGDVILRAFEDDGQLVELQCDSGHLCHNSDFFVAALSGSWQEAQVPLGSPPVIFLPETASVILDFLCFRMQGFL